MQDMTLTLLSQMTLEEKISLLAGIDTWHIPGIPRLGLYPMKVTDGPHGCRTIKDERMDKTIPATCFPTGTALAATWNPGLVKRVGQAIGKEAADRGCSLVLGPCVNIHRSPLGGRNFESYSEDPFLSATMAVNFVEGIQSNNVGACIKHFALNNSEHQRFTISSEADQRSMREIYFPSFEKAIREAGAWSVMCSYNRVNSKFASENEQLLTGILKEEWGLKGPVISDWFATHSTVPAARAGLDIEMPGPARFFGSALKDAVERGEVSESLIDDKVKRVLDLMIKTGCLEKRKITPERFHTQHWVLARHTAEESIVLLKNEGDVLPLQAKSIKKLAIIGPQAMMPVIQGGGSSKIEPYYTVSPLTAIKKNAGQIKLIKYEPGYHKGRLTRLFQTRYLSPPSGKSRRGLTAEYFTDSDFSKKVYTATETEFLRQWYPDNPPGKGLDINRFALRWSGYLVAPESGMYRFGLLTDGWGSLNLSGSTIIENHGDAREQDFIPRNEMTAEVKLESGCKYELELKFMRNPACTSSARSIRLGCNIPDCEDLAGKAVELAARSDAAVVFAGLDEEYESEGFDRDDMELPANQVELIRQVAEVNKKTIVILNNGSPLSMGKWLDKVPAVLEAWYTGQESGRATAAVLFGRINPSGKLPDTFPARYEDNPSYRHYPGSGGRVEYAEGIFTGYRHYDQENIEPLFPFGHGLSYTVFEYNNLKLSGTHINETDEMAVRIEIKNIGKKKGKETVQLYIRDIESSLPRPPRELKGFKKVELIPQEAKTIEFIIKKNDLAYFDPERQKWTVEPGEFEVLIGSSSRDIRARASFYYGTPEEEIAKLAKLVLDLHDIYNRGAAIDAELNRIIQEAVDKKIALVEIIPGKGAGQLKKKVLRFLAQPQIKTLYHRIEKDDKNFGRIFVHFKH